MSIGYNYFPSKQGCDFWKIWDLDEIERDFQQMAEEGSRLVRFFIFWKDFEPVEGQYDDVMFQRLKEFVELAERYQLYCIPSVLTIWMNGQLFDLPWQGNRDFWKDPFMILKQRIFIEKVTAALLHCPNIYAMDLGDEATYIHPQSVNSMNESELNQWLQQMTEGIRKINPLMKIIMANDYKAVLGHHGFHIQRVAKYTDFIAIHGFPNWSPFQIESNTSYKASLYVPFLVKISKIFGKPLIDEFGVYAASEENRFDYITTSGVSSILHGAQAIIAWKWKDSVHKSKPYIERPWEAHVGFHDQAGNKKKGTDAFRSVSQWFDKQHHVHTPDQKVAIYIPYSYYKRYVRNSDTQDDISLFYAFLLLTRSHFLPEFVSVHSDLEEYGAVIVPSIKQFSLYDLECLQNYVRQGGTILASPGSLLDGFGGEELFGIELDDFSLNFKDEFQWKDMKFLLDWNQAGFDQIPIIRNTQADIISSYRHSGSPALTCNRYGKGKAYYLNAPIERTLHVPNGLENENYRFIYQYILDEVGIRPAATYSSPAVEIHTLSYSDITEYVLINHSPDPQYGTLTVNHQKLELNLNKKSIVRICAKENEFIAIHDECDFYEDI